MKIIFYTVIWAVITALACAPTNPKGNNTGEHSPPPSVSAVTVSAPEITLAEYDQIKKGMTYDQVRSIIGVAGEVASDGQFGAMATKSYRYRGAGCCSSALVTFTNGKVRQGRHHQDRDRLTPPTKLYL